MGRDENDDLRLSEEALFEVLDALEEASVDPHQRKIIWADGSRLSLRVTRQDGTYSVVLTDEQTTACGLDGAGRPLFAAEVDATGTADGNVLRTLVTVLRCLSDPPASRDVSLSIDYTYRSDSDTLIDSSQGAEWHRP